MKILEIIDFKKQGGLVPGIVREANSGDILMLGYLNYDSLKKTLKTGKLHLWSRSRKEIWLKGKKSGNFLMVKDIFLDCDNDSLIIDITEATGETAVCHTGAKTCFFKKIY